jgi:hypothetical protein
MVLPQPPLPRFIHLPHIDDVGYCLPSFILLSKLNPSHPPLPPTFVASLIPCVKLKWSLYVLVAYLRKDLCLVKRISGSAVLVSLARHDRQF